MQGLKKEFESSTVNNPSVFEPLRLYCSIEDVQEEPQSYFGHLQQLPILLSVLLVVIKSGIRIQFEVSRLKKCLNPTVVYSTGGCPGVSLTLCCFGFILRGDLY